MNIKQSKKIKSVEKDLCETNTVEFLGPEEFSLAQLAERWHTPEETLLLLAQTELTFVLHFKWFMRDKNNKVVSGLEPFFSDYLYRLSRDASAVVDIICHPDQRSPFYKYSLTCPNKTPTATRNDFVVTLKTVKKMEEKYPELKPIVDGNNEKPCLTMAQLMELSRKSENDVLEMALDCSLPFYTHKGILANGPEGSTWGLGIVPRIAVEFLKRNGKVKIEYLTNEDGTRFARPSSSFADAVNAAWYNSNPGFILTQPPAKIPRQPEITASQLFVMAEDLEKIKAWHPEFFTTGKDQGKGKPSFRHGAKNRITLAMEDAWSRLIKKGKGKEPSADEVYTMLKNDDKTDVVIDYHLDSDTGKRWLVWEDHDGKPHDIQYKTIANKLSKMRCKNR